MYKIMSFIGTIISFWLLLGISARSGIIGAGPYTFAFDFPQDDLIGKYYAYDTSNIVMDKAHNLYLQMAINLKIH